MKLKDSYELPPDKQPVHARAVRLEWITIAYMTTAIVLLALTLGQSQAMKAAWIEDILALAPPIAFLVASRYRERPPNERFPYGYHRSMSIAFLAAAISLLTLGAFILFDSILRLARFEHPPLGLVELFGQQIWVGWLMIGALLYSGIPPVFLGRMKEKVAGELHDKVLYADAEMNRADWMTAGAAILGIIGIGAGLWWADSVAAIVISLDIVRDGLRNVSNAVKDLMDERPTTYDDRAPHPLPDQVLEQVRVMDWVDDAVVRMREEGHVFAGEVLVVPRNGVVDLPRRVEQVTERLKDLDWRLHDLVVVPVQSIERPNDDHDRDEAAARDS